ncbi:VOC family protein [Pontivivens nitratireducens]|uniref:VOC domain-containing protein n=1 Tax=Pontivivens nitratireducens TaxID=2758038 RepID=A0A6G7VMX5_9RHOB|nr:VOC family protein [Pontibrevibacter nitratireducens]QIK41443.1 hypothetical protein G8E03_12090 [Pontibrevibacter nitratireducens]
MAVLRIVPHIHGDPAALSDFYRAVFDLDATLARARSVGAEITYGPVVEDWGVRRFFLRDPAGYLLNVLTHIERD